MRGRSVIIKCTASIAIIVSLLQSSVVFCASGDPIGSLIGTPALIRLRDSGAQVKALQQVLKDIGYNPGPLDGIFGQATLKAVKEFQEDMGILVDGIVGEATKAALKQAYERKYPKAPPGKHIVRSGETLTEIARSYGISLSDIVSWNRISDPNLIREGDILSVTAPKESESGGSSRLPAQDQTIPVLPSKKVCLTFDDGPDPSTTLAILNTLEKYGIKATFFVIGENVRKYPELAREIASRGHALGVHGYSHKLLAGLDYREIRRELADSVDAIREVTGLSAKLFRPPGGLLDQSIAAEAARLGLTTMMWTNVGGADLDASGPEDLIPRLGAWARDGAILLLHEGHPPTVQALSEMIEGLARMGFGFSDPSSWR